MFEHSDIRKHCNALNELIKKYCQENSLAFNPANISYSPTEFNYRCQVKATDEGGNVALGALDASAVRTLLVEGHATPEVLNAPSVIGHKVYIHNGTKVVTIIGFNRKRPKYCWTIDVNGQTKCCNNELINWHRGFAD